MFDDEETKAILLEIVNTLETEYDHDLSEGVGASFKWTYPERPHIQFQLIIKELDEIAGKETIH